MHARGYHDHAPLLCRAQPCSTMDEEDSSIFALLAATAAGDGDGADAGKLAYRELPPQQVWSETVLVDAWTAAMNEFKVYASSSKSAAIPTLDREAQLLASPLWYAPPCPKPSASSSSSSNPAKRPLAVVSQEDEADDYHEQEVEDEEDLPIEDVQDVQLIEEITDKQPHTQHRRAPTAGHIHPSRLDHVPNTEPYFNPEEWEPVVRSNGSAASVKALHNALKPSEALLAVPEPPPVEQAIPQEQALLDTRSSQEALEKALQAWYTAGYAAALYHVRSGAVKP